MTGRPMHPTGRCTCAGEGLCPWCACARADERVEEALDALAAAREARSDALAAVREAERLRRMAAYHAHESARRRVR